MKNKYYHTGEGAIVIEGHIQGLSNTRSLGEKGIRVIVIDRQDCIARYSRYCSAFYKCPEFNSIDLVQFLIDIAVENQLKNWFLIPSNDHALKTIVSNSKTLDPYFNLSTLPSSESVNIIYDKINLLTIAKNELIPYPKTETFRNEISNAPPFPIMIKGRNGLSFYKLFGVKAIIASNQDEYEVAIKEIEEKVSLDEVFLQEIIPDHEINPTISFTSFSINGDIKSYWIGEKIRQHPLQFGTATFCRSVENDRLYNPSKILLKSLNYTGVCEIEYLLDPRDREYKLIEINARTWLWVGLAKACGVDYIYMLYNYAKKNQITNKLGGLVDIKWVNLLTDTPYSILAIIKGKLKLKDYIKSFSGKLVSASFSWKDIKPAIVFPFILILYSKKRKSQN